MTVLLVIASLVVRYLPLYHTTSPHPELNIPCEADLLLPYIRFSSVLPFLESLPCVRVFHLLYIPLPSWLQSAGDIVTFQLRTGRKRGYHYRGKEGHCALQHQRHHQARDRDASFLSYGSHSHSIPDIRLFCLPSAYAPWFLSSISGTR